MARKSKKKNTTITVDMDGVTSGNKLKDGDYIFTVDEVSLETGNDSGKKYLKWVAKENDSGSVVYNNTSLTKEALFSLRSMLEALGLEVPNDKMDLELTDYPGMEFGGTVVNEVYNGKKKPVLVEVYPVDDLDDSEDEEPSEEEEEEEPSEEEEEEEASKKKGKKSSKKKGKKKFEVDAKVSFEDEDEEVEGKITEIDGDTITVLVDDEEWELDKSDLTLI